MGSSMTADRSAAVHRILDRYLVEVVEAYDLCPWARSARQGGEVATAIVWGAPSIDAWCEAARAALAMPTTRVAMIVAPELAATPADLRVVRDAVAAQTRTAGVAHFHPDATLDLATPARLVPFVRRAPDPLLQLVPLALLENLRGAPPVLDRARQAQLLGGTVQPLRGDIAERIAEANHAVVSAQLAAITAVLDDIAADRRATYARVGISACR